MRDSGKVLASQDVTLKADGQLQTETPGVQLRRGGAEELSKSAWTASPVRRTRRIIRSAAWSTWSRASRASSTSKASRAGSIKFIRRAVEDYPDLGIELAAMVRTTQNKILRQFPKGMDEHDLEDGFPSKPEELFQFQGLIIGSVEANYFTPAQQQLIHDFVDRRGGGLLFLGGRASLSDGGYPQFATGRSDSGEVAGFAQGHLPSRFHRPVELTARGARASSAGWSDDPARNAERWKTMPQMANYQDVGEPNRAPPCCWNPRPRANRQSRCW